MCELGGGLLLINPLFTYPDNLHQDVIAALQKLDRPVFQDYSNAVSGHPLLWYIVGRTTGFGCPTRTFLNIIGMVIDTYMYKYIGPEDGIKLNQTILSLSNVPARGLW